VVPDDTMIGALIRYITHPDQKNLQPINANWGIIHQPPDIAALQKDARRDELSKRALKSIATVFGAPAAV